MTRAARRTSPGEPLDALYGPALPAGDRRAGQRRLPGRPVGLPRRPARARRPLRPGHGCRDGDADRRQRPPIVDRQLPDPRGRHLQVARARDQEPEDVDNAPMRRKRKYRSAGMSRFTAGLIALALIVVATFFGFTQVQPVRDTRTSSQAVFETANNLKPKSPVRIAGVEVGKVKKVEPLARASGAARVTMEIKEHGLPIHEDASSRSGRASSSRATSSSTSSRARPSRAGARGRRRSIPVQPDRRRRCSSATC